MERRKATVSKSTPLPLDYLKMVTELFTTHFDAGLKALSKVRAGAGFHATGAIFADEIVLTVSLIYSGQISATTVMASIDFEPKASSPTAQDLLGACVDALAGAYGELLNPKNKKMLEAIADESLSALEDVPFQWTPYEIEKHKVFIRVDRSNPLLDEMTDAWLEKNDPSFRENQEEEQKKSEELFVTGPKKKPTIH